jgi:prepilin-type processing-associated H-X9-DG protein
MPVANPAAIRLARTVAVTIEYTCPCGQRLRAGSEDIGQLMRCPACGRQMTVPGDAGQLPSTDAGEPRLLEARAVPIRGRNAPPGDWDDEGADRGIAAQTSGKAVAALILGLLSLCLSLVAGVPAVLCGVLSLGDISRSGGRLRGQGMAIAGIVLGGVGSLLIAPLILIALLVPAVQKVRSAAERIKSANNMKILSLGMMNYADDHGGQLPPAVVYGPDGKPLYSWRALLLPYIEEERLYHQFRFDEPWDGPNNRVLIGSIPKVYQDPGYEAKVPGMTHYQVFDGPGAAFDSSSRPFRQFMPKDVNQPLRLQMSAFQIRCPRDFTDGTGNTFLIVESADGVPWTSPQNLPFGPGKPLPKLGRPSRDGFNAAFADGSVRHVPSSTSEQTIRALITPNGGEILGRDAP